MGSYTFKWEHPEASEVFVTGTFDDWGKTHKLAKQPNGFFEEKVTLPKKEKYLYKFVVDGQWITNSHLPTERDHNGNENNVLEADQIEALSLENFTKEPLAATIATVTAGATTLGLAGLVGKNEKPATSSAPGAFPETPAAEPSDFSVKPIAVSEGAGNPVSLKPGEPVPELANSSITSGVHDDPELVAADKAAEESTFSAKPIPATAGIGNPIHLQPGEPVPDASTLTGSTLDSTVKTDKASYEASDAAASAAPPADATAKDAEVNPAETGLFGVPPATGAMIPESSLPIGEGTSSTKDDGPGAGILLGGVGAAATTLGLAAAVPKNERGVPEVVSESQQEAGVSPEAAANPVAVEEKKEVESELKSKVHEEPPAAESGLPTGKVVGAVTGGVAAATAAVGGAAAVATERAKNIASDASAASKGMLPNDAPAASVPEPVKESISEAHASPEAAANPEAVEEKSAVENELAKKISPVESAGEPAPTITAATSEKAPEPTKDSSALNASAAAPATTPATAESIKPETVETAPTPVKNGAPATTTGVTTESTSAKSEAGPATPSKKTDTAADTPASKLTDATDTPDSKADKKKKRRSVFIQKIKKIFD